MGIYLSVLALDETTGAAVTDYPPLWAPLIGMDGWDDPGGPIYRRCQRNYHRAGGRDRRGLMSRVLGSPLDDFRLTTEPRHVYLDKSWAGMHWLFTRTASAQAVPHGFLCARALKPNAATVAAFKGWSRAPRVLSHEQTRRVAMWLEATTDATLETRFDPRAMGRDRVYPDIIWERDGAEALGYVMGYVRELRRFALETVSRGDVLAVY